MSSDLVGDNKEKDLRDRSSDFGGRASTLLHGRQKKSSLREVGERTRVIGEVSIGDNPMRENQKRTRKKGTAEGSGSQKLVDHKT